MTFGFGNRAEEIITQGGIIVIHDTEKCYGSRKHGKLPRI